MEIIRDEVFKAALIKRIAEREFQERTGVHQSDLVYCLNKQALRRLQPQEPQEHEVLLFSLGHASQRWLTGTFKPETEYEKDGIVVTPDSGAHIILGTSSDDYFPEPPWELKATYQSANKPLVENIAWIRQVMAECYVTNTLVGYLTRMEIMGDWRWVFGKKEEKQFSKHPTLSAYRLEFSQQEIDGNWAWLVKRRELFLNVLKTGQLLPKLEALGEGMDFECSYCGYKDECEEAQ